MQHMDDMIAHLQSGIEGLMQQAQAYQSRASQRTSSVSSHQAAPHHDASARASSLVSTAASHSSLVDSAVASSAEHAAVSEPLNLQ